MNIKAQTAMIEVALDSRVVRGDMATLALIKILGKLELIINARN